MNLQPTYFDYIKTGTKRIELRLYDEKRQQIALGDTIEFAKSEQDKFQAKVIGLLSKPLLESDPQISVVDIKRCVGCGKCIKVCPFQAIVEKEIRGEKKAQTIEAVCQGCGLCTATCPQGAIQLSHFTDNQILAEVDALCRF